MSNLRFTPSPGYILLKITEPQSETIMVAQDTDKTPASMGEVIATGEEYFHEGGKYIKCPVKVGDQVVFKPYGIDSIYLNNTEHRIVPFQNIRGVLK